MNFASSEFWYWLLACFTVSRLILLAVRRFVPHHESGAAKVCLLATSCCLLAVESWLTLGAFVWVVGCGWLAVRAPARRGRLVWLVLMLALQLAPLFYYKYWNFVCNGIFGFGWRVPSVLIPMGLSFYTFQTLAFWIDSSKPGAARPRLLDYLTFSSFFPQIVAGPIERRADLMPQVGSIRFRLHREHLDEALPWIVLGLAYKMVVADNVAALSASMALDPGNAWHVWFECFAFAIRIYFDFAGYSFIAVGLGLLFGVRLTLNFNAPYWSADLRAFWRTWHITLGSWMRDYIYLPLGGRRSRRWVLNLLVVFLVSGVWHGAGWGFVLWGMLHGLGVALCAAGRPWRLPVVVKWGATMLFVVVSWLFFFERDPAMLRLKVMTLIAPGAYAPAGLKSLAGIFGSKSELILAAVVFALAATKIGLEGLGKRLGLAPYQLLRRPLAACVLVVLIVLLASTADSPFIYFNF
ncbi:MBOAT family O-acyltransferase [Luteolibacter marinus]|uniref:MBOAT family O-acyltransferase n=1 Tax=Luteolibacter marinus TaxID=2776705 RepID=UPI001865C37A|nr:MBOAT family protein [Luteolibacter marinus]